MFLRKLTVIALPLGMLILLCLVIPLFASMNWFWGSLLLGTVLGVMLSLLLPLAGATRFREPFAHLMWIPAALILLVLLWQFLSTQNVDVPLLRLLTTRDFRIVTAESAFAAYMITFSIRTGKGV